MDRFRFVVERAPDGVVILVRGAIVFINPTAIRLLGADPATVIGSRVVEYLPPADALATGQRIAEMYRTGIDMPPSEYGVNADPRRVVEIKSTLCDWEGERAVIAFARDVTERKAMQDKLAAGDRFAALGKLAAGVAHEINNPLAYAQLSVELMTRRLTKLASALDAAEVAELRELLGDTMHGLERIGSVTNDLRTFARHDDTPPGAVDLAGVVEQSLRMVDNELRHRAKLVRAIDADVLPVMGNASRLEQVFVNVLLNAVQALRDPARDVVTVRVAQASSEAARVEIADTGHGIPAAIINRVFDPFFTTREVGEGMGLGLGVCKNIVEASGGTIAIASSAAGTTATIHLPTFRQARISSPAIQPVLAPELTEVRRRVMIIDDEPFVRATLVALLAAHHDATQIDSAAAALTALDATEPPDVILCDVMMPGMNGIQLYREIAERYPSVERRIIFVTGGVFAAESTTFLADSGAPCLAKPFKLDQVLAAIATV